MTSDIWPTIHAERSALAEDLSGLSPEQWALPTMCAEWDVHDVLAHLVSAAKMTPPKFLGKLAGAGFSFNKFTANQVALEGAGGPEKTLAAFTAAQRRTSAPPGPKDTWLGEAFVHGEDIRRPLGIMRAYPLRDVGRALTFYTGSDPIIGGKTRVAGLTLQATDLEVRIGEGPVVEGPVMSLLLATSGRGQAIDELSGPGVDTLRARCGGSTSSG
jgi:uncharacterized protein (TIGR03083 family)